MTAARVRVCLCGHPRDFHAKGVGACRCGCTQPRFFKRGGLEVLHVIDPGVPGKVAPTYRVRDRACGREYETRTWLRELLTRRSCRLCSDARRRRRAKGPSASRPSDMPRAERFEHGTRSRYVSGCRCEPCTAANREYARLQQKNARAGIGDPLIPTGRARAHLARLSAAGVGLRTVADVAGVPRSSVVAIRTGKKTKCRRSTLERLLRVTRDAVGGDASLVDSASTWSRLDELLASGFTKGAIAEKLGHKTKALQLRRGRRVTARTRAAVERLYRQYNP